MYFIFLNAADFAQHFGMLGFWHRYYSQSFSISNEWELVRILVIAFLYLKFFTKPRYFSMYGIFLYILDVEFPALSQFFFNE